MREGIVSCVQVLNNLDLLKPLQLTKKKQVALIEELKSVCR